MSKKGGYYCAFKNCRSLSRRDKRSFFRFPKDPQRSKQWVQACDRSDLNEKTPIELFNSYRVCAKHFTDTMFLNDLRNRLQPNSVPVQMEPPEEQITHIDKEIDFRKEAHNNGNSDNVAKLFGNCLLQKITAEELFQATGIKLSESGSAIKSCDVYLENLSPLNSSIDLSTKENNDNAQFRNNTFTIDIDNENPTSFSIETLNCLDIINALPLSIISEPSSLDTNHHELPSIMPRDKNILDSSKLPDTIFEEVDSVATESNIPTISSNLNESATQTETSFIRDKLYTKKVRRLLQNKKNLIKNLKKRVKRSYCDVMNEITMEQYLKLTDKFFPKETSNFIKAQAKLFTQKDSLKTYTPEFEKHKTKLYTNYLQKIFCLPVVQELQTQIE